MDVAFVSNVVYPFVKGGAEKRIYEVGRRLAADGHDVTVYGRHFWDGPRERTFEGMTLRAVAPERSLYTDGRRSIPEAIGFAAALPVPLGRHVSEHDVVDASVFPYFPVLTARVSTLLAGTPLVTTWHEVWDDYWEEYLGRLAPFGKAVERVTARTAGEPVAVSESTADRLAAIGPSRDRITVVPNGIDADDIASVPAATNEYDVLFAGRHTAEKRVDVLLRAFDRVAVEHDATLGVIGEGPETERLRALADGLTNGHRIEFLGFLDDHDDVLAQMRAADVFASASTREGFGMTFVEAMAADCTVVAAAHAESAASEVVGEAGFLVPPTVDGFSDALGRVLGGERPATDPVEAARRYDWDGIVDRTVDLYRRVQS